MVALTQLLDGAVPSVVRSKFRTLVFGNVVGDGTKLGNVNVAAGTRVADRAATLSAMALRRVTDFIKFLPET
jgi:hypothetical protein